MTTATTSQAALTREEIAAVLKRPVDFGCEMADQPFPFWIEQAGQDGLGTHGQYHFTNEADARSYAAKLNECKPRWRFQVYTWNPEHLADKNVRPKGILL